MSRIASAPVPVPSGVEIRFEDRRICVKGSKGEMEHEIHAAVEVVHEDSMVKCSARETATSSVALAGTTRALVNNMVTGVSTGFEKKLQLVGVGYRAQMQGKNLHLTLGYSHPIDFPVPDGIEIEAPTQTEIIVKGIDKQKVGQVAATIREFRPPEPYKGKGVRYADENVVRKEAKKK